MFVSRGRVKPQSILVVLARACALGAAALAAGCASDKEQREQVYGYSQQAHADQAAAAAAAAQRPQKSEVEDDGLPSQVPPPVNRRREPDDPSEPYSPNYGAPARRAEAPVAPVAATPQRIAAR